MLHIILKETGEKKPVNNYVRIDLTDDEIKIIISGKAIQTQIPWLSIGRKIST
jgi:hypothetical protein